MNGQAIFHVVQNGLVPAYHFHVAFLAFASVVENAIVAEVVGIAELLTAVTGKMKIASRPKGVEIPP